jgi:hypothetical protein
VLGRGKGVEKMFPKSGAKIIQIFGIANKNRKIAPYTEKSPD